MDDELLRGLGLLGLPEVRHQQLLPPRGVEGGALSAGEPRGGEHINTLADRGQKAKVVTRGADFSQECPPL